MCLRIYTNKSDIPADMKYVDYNDKFFNSVALEDNEVTAKILHNVDKASYHSKDTFISRDIELGALNKALLSTGCKTLLNIERNPDICFDIVECGQNAIRCLSTIKNGNVLWVFPFILVEEDSLCDIEVNGRKFNSTLELAKYFEEMMENSYE